MSATTIDTVQTASMTCERLRPDHADELVRLLCDPLVARWIWPPSELPDEELVRRGLADKIEHWERYGFGMWLLRDRASGEMVGRGGLQWTYVANLNEVEAGWAIVPERWGQGLATELARASVDAAFGPLGLEEIIAFTLPDNLASRRVMGKAGFAYEREIVYTGLAHVLYRRRRAPSG